MTRIVETPIDVPAILAAVGSPRAGAIDMFVGTVRDHSGGKSVQRLEYSAYLPMATKIMEDIETDIRSRWNVESVAMVHRIGMLLVGEVAVVTAVSSSHRREAFEACRYAIDRVKLLVPIWKKEFSDAGTAWVDGEHMVQGEGNTI